MSEKKRRQRGQVIPLEAGDRRMCRTWGVRVPLKERAANGRHKTHYETLYHTTEPKADKRKNELLALIDAGLFFRPAPMTFAALLDEWLQQKERKKLSPASLDSYRDASSAYLRPYFGHLLIGEITPAAVGDCYNALQDRGLSRCTLRYARTLLNLVLRYAVGREYLTANKAASVELPEGVGGRTAHCLNVDEARQLIETASLDLNDLIFIFALLTGLRPREYAGLQWPHLELTDERALVRVRQVAVKVRGGGWQFRRPKTENAVRDVPFPAWLYQELLRWRALQGARRRALGAGWHDYGLVFPGFVGAPQSADAIGERLKRLLKRAGLPDHFTPYSLRYTYATLQFLAGERDKVISNLMGHAKVNFTKDVYTKVLPEMQAQAADSLERLLFGAARTTLAQSEDERIM